MAYLTAILQFAESHILAIFFALIATYIIGFFWHGPLFGKQWIALNNMTLPKKEDMKFSMMLPGLIANLILVIVLSSVLGAVFQSFSVVSVWDALMIVTLAWLAFTALVIVNIYTWSGKSAKLTVLDCAHALVSMWAIALVLYFML